MWHMWASARGHMWSTTTTSNRDSHKVACSSQLDHDSLQPLLNCCVLWSCTDYLELKVVAILLNFQVCITALSKMITPAFDLSQDHDYLILSIRVPYTRTSEFDLYIDGTDFKFYAKPYFLRWVEHPWTDVVCQCLSLAWVTEGKSYHLSHTWIRCLYFLSFVCICILFPD